MWDIKKVGGIISLLSVLIAGCVHPGPYQQSVPSVASPYRQDNIPRGIRNNNPGNIIKTKIKWRGEIECGDKRFECFSDARYGIRAAAIILNTYWSKYSARAVSDFIYRWAPPADKNPTENYTKFVEERIKSRSGDWYMDGIGRVCLSSRKPLPYLFAAIIEFENGYNPYSITLIKEAFNGLSPRANNNARFYFDWRNPKAMGHETPSASRASQADPTSIDRAAWRVEGSTRDYKQRNTIYSSNHCTLCDLRNYRMAFNRPTRFPWNTGHAWMDRISSGVLVLYRREGRDAMEISDWPSNHSPTYPPYERNKWAVFRRIAGWAQSLIV